MKKTFKIIIAIATIFIFSFVKIKADESITFSCDYSFSTGSGTAKIRLKFTDIDREYYKSDQLRYDASNDYIKAHVLAYYNTSGSTSFSNIALGGSTKDFAGNPKNAKLVMLNVNSAKSLFNSSSVQNSNVKCPNLYRTSSNTTFEISNLASFCTLYDTNATGECIDSVSNIQLTFDGTNCYTNAQDSSPKRCEEVIKDDLYNEDEAECKYSSNTPNVYYKLIYNKTKNTLVFNPLTDSKGNGFTIDSSVQSKVENNKIYITDSSIINLFSKVSTKKATCPKRISCDCKVNLLGDKGNCIIENGSNNIKCGHLDGVNGTDVEKLDDYNSSSGNKPAIPDLNISDEPMTCNELLGTNLSKIVKLFFTILRVGGAIIAIVKGSMLLMPAVIAKDAEALKKAGKSCVMLAIALAIIGLLPTIAKILGNILGFDVSCLI